MSHYQPAPRRALFGIAAFAFSALTIAATVVLPATVSPSRLDASNVVAACAPATLLAAPPDFRLHLDVVGTPQRDVEAAAVMQPDAKRAAHG
jgi:hypothetical protein